MQPCDVIINIVNMQITEGLGKLYKKAFKSEMMKYRALMNIRPAKAQTKSKDKIPEPILMTPKSQKQDVLSERKRQRSTNSNKNLFTTFIKTPQLK